MIFDSYLTWVIVLVTFVAFLLRRRFTYWSRVGLPGPGFIEWRHFIGVHHERTVESVRKYGRVYGSYDIMRNTITISEPDILRDMMVKNFHIFPNRKHFNMGSSKVSQSLFLLDGNDDWKRVRSILSPSFTSGKLRAMMSHISDISDQFVNTMADYEKKGAIVDMRKYVGAFAMDVISACAYGIRVDSINNPNHPIVTNAKRILGVDVSLSMIVSVLAPPLARALKLEFFDLGAVNYFDKLTNDILKERKISNKNETIDKKKRKTDFIQLMLDSEKQEDIGYDSNSDGETNNLDTFDKTAKGTLTPDELTAQGILFFIAGYDTTSASITHTIYYLSLHKDCQKRLYEELQTLSDFSYETLNQLKYLNAVIDETLRLAPPLTRVHRQSIADYKLENTGITIPAGTPVEIFPYAVHRDPEFWPEPDRFNPDRFLEPKHHPYAYIPFGGGPRLCIGQRFALNEMRMCIAKLVNRFEFSLVDGFKLEYFQGNILMSPKELLVNLKAR